MAKTSRRPTSRSSAGLTTSNLQGPQQYLRTIQRQHKITIRRLDNIARRLDAMPEEELPEERQRGSGLVAWFLRMVGGRG